MLVPKTNILSNFGPFENLSVNAVPILKCYTKIIGNIIK